MVKPDLAAEITDVRAIIAFRNQLTHAYSAVDHADDRGLLQQRVPRGSHAAVGNACV